MKNLMIASLLTLFASVSAHAEGEKYLEVYSCKFVSSRKQEINVVINTGFDDLSKVSPENYGLGKNLLSARVRLGTDAEIFVPISTRDGGIIGPRAHDYMRILGTSLVPQNIKDAVNDRYKFWEYTISYAGIPWIIELYDIINENGVSVYRFSSYISSQQQCVH